MVKGTMRKATMEKITKRESAATTYIKRTYGLHRKIAQLFLLTDAQIAVLATPPSANSNVSFFSFGHTSVDSIVNAYLKGDKPVREGRDDHDDEDLGICLARKELGLPQWWESDRLLKSKNLEELRRAMNSVLRLLAKIKELRAEDADTRQAYVSDEDAEKPSLKKKKKSNCNETMEKTEPTEQTLVLPSGSSEERVKTLEYNNVLSDEELDQIMSTYASLCVPHNNNNNNNNDAQDMDFDQLIDLDFDFDFESLNSSANSETLKMAEPVDQPLILPSDCCATPDNNNTFSTGEEMSPDHEFFDDSLLESTNSAMSALASSVDGGFVETNSTQERLQETTTQKSSNSCAVSSVACDDYDASAVNDEDASFSDYLTQLLQF